MLAKKLLTATAVETLAAELRVVRHDAVTDGEPLDLGTNRGNNTNSLMTLKKIESGEEVAVSNAEVERQKTVQSRARVQAIPGTRGN